MVDLVQVGDADVAELERFLRGRLEESMFLLSNLRAHGIVDRGQRLHGTYVAARDGAQIVGVACHYRRGNLAVSAPHHAGELGRFAGQCSGRPITGAVEPESQVDAVQSALGLGAGGTVQLDERETLYRLELDRLVRPQALLDATVRGRPFAADDLATMIDWTVRYRVEATGDAADDALRQRVEAGLRREVGDLHWVLEHEGQPVAKTAFNARLADAVQIGGVYTPPSLRGRGYGRCVVASHLDWARSQGVALAILFTGDDNVPARRAYEALGFEAVGRYRLLLA